MSANLTYAGWLERVFAYLIDTLILLLPCAVVAALLRNEGLASVAAFVVSAVYFTYFVSGGWQATPAQRMLGMYVTHPDGTVMSQRDAIERFLAFMLPTLPLYTSVLSQEIAASFVFWLNLLWFVPIVFTPERMGIHDRLCNTRVVIGKVLA